MKEFFLACSFLTIIPANRKWNTSTANIRKTIFWFPVVGLLIGLLLSVVYYPLTKIIPIAAADAFIIIIYVLLTGCLHLDGFADTCDGILGGNTKERRLTIMRDSAVGSFGVIGLICLLGIKYLSLCLACDGNLVHVDLLSIFNVFFNGPFDGIGPEHSCIVKKMIVLFLFPSIGRWAQVFGASVSRYARENESGTGSFIIQNSTPILAFYSALIPSFFLYLFLGFNGLWILMSVAVLCFIFVCFIRSKIGGMTGDTLGTLNEITELMFLGVFML